MVLLQLLGSKNMPLAENLQQLRKERGIRQEQLAELSGVSLTQISKIERNETDPRISTIEKLAKALSCSGQQLIFNEESEGLDGMLKRSYDRVKRLEARDKAAIIKVINMACAGGMVMRNMDDLYEDARKDEESIETEAIELDHHHRYHDQIDAIAQKEEVKISTKTKYDPKEW